MSKTYTVKAGTMPASKALTDAEYYARRPDTSPRISMPPACLRMRTTTAHAFDYLAVWTTPRHVFNKARR